MDSSKGSHGFHQFLMLLKKDYISDLFWHVAIMVKRRKKASFSTLLRYKPISTINIDMMCITGCADLLVVQKDTKIIIINLLFPLSQIWLEQNIKKKNSSRDIEFWYPVSVSCLDVKNFSITCPIFFLYPRGCIMYEEVHTYTFYRDSHEKCDGA